MSELTSELIQRFMKIDPATLGHYVKGGFMDPSIKPICKESKLIGPAYTVRLMGKDSLALYLALMHAPKGSVIVVDRCGDTTYACCGEMVTLYAKCQGMAGIVIDGPATDSLALEKMGFPVFCKGISAVTTNTLGISGDMQVPVSCAGAVVHPGDIVFGDADGVLVLPPDDYEEAVKKAEESVAFEVKLREHFLSGGQPLYNYQRLWDANVPGMINDLKRF